MLERQIQRDKERVRKRERGREREREREREHLRGNFVTACSNECWSHLLRLGRAVCTTPSLCWIRVQFNLLPLIGAIALPWE